MLKQVGNLLTLIVGLFLMLLLISLLFEFSAIFIGQWIKIVLAQL